MNRFLYLLLLSIALYSCLHEEALNQKHPEVITDLVTNINTFGAQFSANGQYPSDAIVEHGFVWGKSTNPTLEDQENYYSKLGAFGGGEFTQKIMSTLVAGFRYNVRGYIQTKTKTVYGPIVDFKSLGSQGPTLIKIEPSNANIGDMVTLFGYDFSENPIYNDVTIGGKSAKVLTATKSKLSVRIPYITTSHPEIIIWIEQSKSEAQSDLLIVSTASIQLSSSNPTLCDDIIITGKNFPHDQLPQLYFNQIPATFEVIDNLTYKTSTPSKITGPVKINLIWFDNFVTSSTVFEFKIPVINFVNPFVVTVGDYLTISGANFSEPISLKIDNIPVNPILVDDQTIKVLINQSFSLNPDIEVTICMDKFNLVDAFQMN